MAQLAHRYACLFYARISSSEWGLFGHIARSAFRRTPSGREMVTKPAGNLWQADFHPTATREHQSGNRVISEDIEISASKYKLNKKHIKYLHNSK